MSNRLLTFMQIYIFIDKYKEILPKYCILDFLYLKPICIFAIYIYFMHFCVLKFLISV